MESGCVSDCSTHCVSTRFPCSPSYSVGTQRRGAVSRTEPQASVWGWNRLERRPDAGALVTTVPAASVAAHPEPWPFLDHMCPDRMGNSAPELGGCRAAGNVQLPRARAAYGSEAA